MELEELLKPIAKISKNSPVSVFMIIVILTVFMGIAASGIKSETSFEKMLPQDDPVITSMYEIRDAFGGSDSIILSIKLVPSDSSEKIVDIRDSKILELMDYLSNDLSSIDAITSISSPLTAIVAKNGGTMPKNISDVKKIASELEKGGSVLYNDDYSMVVMGINSNANDDGQKQLVTEINNRIEDAPIPAGVEICTTGSPAMRELMGRMMVESQSVTGLASLLAIFTILFIYFRNVVKSILPLISVIIAVIWTAGTMAILGMVMDTATSVMASLLLGLGIDYGIHLYHRYAEELKNGLSQKDALEKSVIHTGSAVLVTTTTTIAGFAALTIAPLTMMANMGKVCSIGIFYCMMAVLFVLPALINIEENYLLPKLKQIYSLIKKEETDEN